MLTDAAMTHAIKLYLADVQRQFDSGHAVEHAYRPALRQLLDTFEDIRAINDPKQSEFGAPDFVLLRDSNTDIAQGYVEAKDVGADLDKTEAGEQMKRYGGYSNLILTDYLNFRFYSHGVRYETLSLGSVEGRKLRLDASAGVRVMREIQDMLARPAEAITSGKRLAEIMGAKAQLIRDNIAVYLDLDTAEKSDVARIFRMMREMLVRDLTPAQYADMYAQTLVYGLFVARYADPSPATFSRAEARDLVPASNPFLRHFFDHIAGASFDDRFARIVDSLCAVFQVSNVQDIVHRHVNPAADVAVDDDKDPIIHFYEDFLAAYDPEQRRRRGAYYTPVPVVRYIIRRIDEALRNDLGIEGGFASDETVTHQYDTGQDFRTDRRFKADTTVKVTVPRVQFLDPAVGTATFLNEAVKFIHKSFEGQSGIWPAYVRENLVPRMYGFELMMGPYTIAHLKLGTTLAELGVPDVKRRLNVMLTNTLAEGVPVEPDLFSFGLAEAVTEESRLAAEVKSQRPVMVVLGNPPYSGVSANETPFANALVEKYKVEPGGEVKLGERKHWLNDDYVKFIAFAEDLIARNGSGIVAMITNHGYLDGVTFRGMRWRLAQTFDRIDILDLHGNSLRKEVSPDGSADQNVFDIMPGVAIIIAVKTPTPRPGGCVVRRADLWGTRRSKFDALNADRVSWQPVTLGRRFAFTHDSDLEAPSYLEGVSVADLFRVISNAAASARDALNFAFDEDTVVDRMEYIRDHTESEIRTKFQLKRDSRDWTVASAKEDVQANFAPGKVELFMYRPFDWRYTFYSGNSRGIYSSPQSRALTNVRGATSPGLMINRGVEQKRPWADVLVTPVKSQYHSLSIKETNSIAPLYVYDPAGEKHSNLDPTHVARLAAKLTSTPSPEEVLAYVYAVLHSPAYRETYQEELKRDFPRVPVPTSDVEFSRLVGLGRDLVKAHLMKDPVGPSWAGGFPVAGTDRVDEVRRVGDRVFINATQYFDGVRESVWEWTVGSFQPAQKWLTERLGIKLSHADLRHYQRLVRGITETCAIVEMLD